MDSSKKLRRKWPKVALLVIAALILLPILVLFGCREVNAARYHIGGAGIQEKTYVTLGGYQQYLNIRGQNPDNPVVIYLHGGPGSPVAFLSYQYQPALEDTYTFINWDQRGSGRTYAASPDAPLSLDNLLNDLDELVDYATNRFSAPVYIVGHSWGSVLGIEYAVRHPEKIAGYIGVGQVTDGPKSGRLQAAAAASAARSADSEDDAQQIETLFSAGASSFGTAETNMERFKNLRTLEDKYLEPKPSNPTLAALVSPDFGLDDLSYQLLLMSDLDGYFRRQSPLMLATANFKPPPALAAPVAFIGGAEDYTCSTELAKHYAESLSAPFYQIPDTGHTPMFDSPHEFSQTLQEALQNLK